MLKRKDSREYLSRPMAGHCFLTKSVNAARQCRRLCFGSCSRRREKGPVSASSLPLVILDYQYKKISDDAKRFVRSYDWPGNIRQLKNTLVEAAVMSERSTIEVGDIQAAIADMPGKSAGLFDQELGSGFCLQTLLEDVHRKYLERAMEEADGVKTKAAELLGMSSYQTLDAQLKRLKARVSKNK